MTNPDGSPRYPIFLPDGHRFLYTKIAAKDSGIFLASLESSEAHRVMPDQSNAQYLPTGPDGIGQLLFVREQTVMAQPVNPRTLAPSGDLFPVAERVPNGPQTNEYLYTISGNGMLLYGITELAPRKARGNSRGSIAPASSLERWETRRRVWR